MPLKQQQKLGENGREACVSNEEIRDMLALHEQRQIRSESGSPSTVADFAEACGIPIGEAEGLLEQVRGERDLANKAKLRASRKRIVAILAGFSALTALATLPFEPNSDANPVFVVNSVTTSITNQGTTELVDVVLDYHPSSMARLLGGPHLEVSNTLPEVMSQDRVKRNMFPWLGGSNVGISFGTNYRLGPTTQHIGYEIPIRMDLSNPVMIQHSITVDGHDLTLNIPLK